MGRNKLIETEEIKLLIDRLSIENPYNNITAADVARLANMSGYSGIEGRIINRNPEARKYLNNVNSKITNEKTSGGKYIVFSTLDVDCFLKNNKGLDSLKKALVQREVYFKGIVSNYNKLAKEHDELKKKLKSSADSAELTARINKLEKFINKYINPSIANELLAKEGLLKELNSYTTPDIIEVLPITSKFDNESLDKISRMFDE